MTQELIFANARVVLKDEVVKGSVLVRDNVIAGIDTGVSVPPGAVDCEGDYLAPGLVELHTDNLERHISPRPKVAWPHRAAIIAHDAELAGTGITTVFDALRVGSIATEGPEGDRRYARAMADEILGIRDTGMLKISHHLHLRAEICSESLVEELEEFGPDDRVGILSLMDHTPGQRQFRDLSKLVDYYKGKHGLGEDAVHGYLDHLRGLRDKNGDHHEAEAIAAATRLGATLASHDDTTAEHVATSRSNGVTVAEFPTTTEAARACHDNAIDVIMGAPNIVRGGSHSGNVSAAELAEADLLDILSSDYVPASLLLGATMLSRKWGDMARGIATVTAHPARAARLEDRGRIAVGLRADLIRFADIEGPILRGAWCQGKRIA